MRIKVLIMLLMISGSMKARNINEVMKHDTTGLHKLICCKTLKAAEYMQSAQLERSELHDTAKAALLLDSALVLYREIIELQDTSSLAWNNIGSCFFFQGRFREALACFNRATGIKPLYRNAWFNIGLTYERLYYKDSAIGALEKCIQIDSAYMSAYVELARVKFESETDHKRAIAFLMEATKHDTASDLPWNEIARYYLDLHDTAKAAETMEKAASVNPSNTTRLYNLGVYFKYRGDAKKSEMYFDLAKKQNDMAH